MKTLTLEQTLARTKLSTSQLVNLIANDNFPEEVGLACWREEDVQNWILKQADTYIDVSHTTANELTLVTPQRKISISANDLMVLIREAGSRRQFHKCIKWWPLGNKKRA